MKVTHVITRLIVGGAQENTIATVLGLQARHACPTTLISGPTTGPEGSLEQRVRVTGQLRVLPELVRPLHPVKDWLTLRDLTARFRADRPDIVHTHSGKAGILGRLAAHRAGVPVIIHTIHGPSFGSFQGSLANFLFGRAEKKAGRITTHFIGVSQAMIDQYLAAGIGRPEQYSLIYSGFDLKPFSEATNDLAFRAQLGIGPKDFVIGKVARLFKLKGHEELFQVAERISQKVPTARFLFVGDGPWRERFEKLLAVHALRPRFVFTGLIPPEEIPKHIGIMNCLVHLSRREGLPRALTQALAAGKPVIAYDCDGAREVCITGRTGHLVQPGDLEALTSALLDLASGSDRRHQLGENGRNLVRERFGVDKMVDDIHALYQRLLGALN